MPPALAGNLGPVSQGVSGAAVTPNWDAGATRAPGNLLFCWVACTGSATIPTLPAGWASHLTGAGTSCSLALFTKAAGGGDAAPTIALVAGGTLSVMVAEFSGTLLTRDRSASVAGTTSPLVATDAIADIQAGELVTYVNAAFHSASVVDSMAVTLSNGASPLNDANNNSTSTPHHYDFGWGITSANPSGDSSSLSFSTTSITGAIAGIGSFQVPGQIGQQPPRRMPLGV